MRRVRSARCSTPRRRTCRAAASRRPGASPKSCAAGSRRGALESRWRAASAASSSRADRRYADLVESAELYFVNVTDLWRNSAGRRVRRGRSRRTRRRACVPGARLARAHAHLSRAHAGRASGWRASPGGCATTPRAAPIFPRSATGSPSSPPRDGGDARIRAVLPRATPLLAARRRQSHRGAGRRRQHRHRVSRRRASTAISTRAGSSATCVTAWDSGAAPVIVLNKADLVDDRGASSSEVAGARARRSPVHAVSANDAGVADALRAYLGAGRTAALLGSSGVGKSSIANALDRRGGAAHARSARVGQPRPAHDDRPAAGAAARRRAS